jgi:hypothetical protein
LSSNVVFGTPNNSAAFLLDNAPDFTLAIACCIFDGEYLSLNAISSVNKRKDVKY